MCASLVALTLQTTAKVLVEKWAQEATERQGGAVYLTSTIVLFVELAKLVASLIFVVLESRSFVGASWTLHRHFVEEPSGLIETAVPAVIFAIQSNLNLDSLEILSAAVHQVLYQMKIITTAVFGRLLLDKVLTPTQWVSCFMLLAGITMVQWPRPVLGEDNPPHAGETQTDPQSSPGPLPDLLGGRKVLAFLAVLISCVSSGFSAVYTEEILKRTEVSIWVRNVQLSVFGAIVAMLVVLSVDGDKVAAGGLLQGYTYHVWLIVLMSSMDGLLCGVMLKYAGATWGCFSTAISIILTSIFSATVMRDFKPDSLFEAGALLVIAASLLWGLGIPVWLTRRRSDHLFRG